MALLTGTALAGGNAGTTTGANFEKAIETSKMGTRVLAFYAITALDGVETNYTNQSSLFQKAIQGVQQVAEMYAVFPPATDAFVVMVAADTLPDYDATSGSESVALRTAVRKATGDTNARAYLYEIVGSGSQYD